MIFQQLKGTRSVYSINNWDKDFYKHKKLSKMISKTIGILLIHTLARKLRDKLLLGEKHKGGTLNKETIQLVQKILKRRKRRIGTQATQTANPSSTLSQPYNEMRPETSVVTNRKAMRLKEDNDDSANVIPKDALVDYEELSDD